MKTNKTFLRLISVLGLAIVLILGGCEKDKEKGKNIIEVLSSDSNLSTLVDVMNYAGIDSVIANNGPLTVFAPSNDAFDDLFTSLGVNGFEDLSLEYLDSIIYYHVLFTELTSTNFVNGFTTTQSPGPDSRAIILLLNETESKLNGDINITAFDLKASNGVIHIIDKVLIPLTVDGIISKIGGLSHFADAVVKAEMEYTFNEKGPITIFVPTDVAFETYFTDLGVSGIADLTKEQLIPLLEHHIINDNLRSTDMSSGDYLTHNGNISLEISNNSIILNNMSYIIAFNLQGKNGVVHVIDEVLIPDIN